MLHLNHRTKLCEQYENYNITYASVFVLWFCYTHLVYVKNIKNQVFPDGCIIIQNVIIDMKRMNLLHGWQEYRYSCKNPPDCIFHNFA